VTFADEVGLGDGAHDVRVVDGDVEGGMYATLSKKIVGASSVAADVEADSLSLVQRHISTCTHVVAHTLISYSEPNIFDIFFTHFFRRFIWSDQTRI
jgi:hypothetical protein